VGCLVLSPYAQAGYISKVLHSHVSLLKFCVTHFNLKAPNKRIASADDMSACFNFSQTPLGPPSAAIKAPHISNNSFIPKFK
jgi:phospholipase C